MTTYFAQLPVDAGMMSIVPVELMVRGKYPKLDAAVKMMQDNPELEALDGDCALVFRVKELIMANVEIDQEDGIVSKFRLDTVMRYSKEAYAEYPLKPGLYILTDPCYVLADPKEDRNSGNYFKVCEALMPGFITGEEVYLKTTVALLDGHAVPVCSSGYGDGLYDAELRVDGNKIWLEVDFMGEDDEDYDD